MLFRKARAVTDFNEKSVSGWIPERVEVWRKSPDELNPPRSGSILFCEMLSRWSALLLLLPQFGLSQESVGGDEQKRFRVDVRAATYEVRVTDPSGNVLKGLGGADFLVEEEGRARPVTFFEERSETPLSLAVLLDASSTMNSESIRTGRRAIHQLIHLLGREDEILLGVYSGEVHFLSELTADRYKLVEGIENIGSSAQPGKWKRLGVLFGSEAQTGYAVDMSLLKLKKSRHKNKVVLVMSAGFGGIGEATLDHLNLAGARFFAVSVDNKLGDIFSLGGDQAARRRIVRDTGGLSYPGRGIIERLSRVRDGLKHYYLLAFSPEEGDDWTSRKVRITLIGRENAVVSAARRTGSGNSFY